MPRQITFRQLYLATLRAEGSAVALGSSYASLPLNDEELVSATLPGIRCDLREIFAASTKP